MFEIFEPNLKLRARINPVLISIFILKLHNTALQTIKIMLRILELLIKNLTKGFISEVFSSSINVELI